MNPDPFTFGELWTMAEVQQEIITGFARLVAACLGVDGGGQAETLMPYNPAILEAIASSGQELR